MEENLPRITVEATGEGICAHLHGCWVASELAPAPSWTSVHTALKAVLQSDANCIWDLRAVERMDHIGAQLLWNTWGHQWPLTLHALPGQRAMLERVARFTVSPPPPQRLTAWDRYLRLGAWVMRMESHVVDVLRLIGQLLLDSIQLLRAPRRGPWRDFSGHLYRIGATALPITALLGFLIGVVLAYLMSRQLRQFGADAFIVNILGVSLVR